MDNDETLSALTEELAECAGWATCDVQPHTPVQSLELDSLDFQQVLWRMENKFDIDLDDTTLTRLVSDPKATVNDLVIELDRARGLVPVCDPRAVNLTEDQAKEMMDTLHAARWDIWEFIRLSEYNLTGRDPMFPDDSPDPIPNPPRTATRQGIQASEAVMKRIEAASAMLQQKLQPKA